MNGSLVPRPARLAASREIVPDHRFMVFEDNVDSALRPGQFVTIALPGIGEFPVSTAGYATGTHIETCIRKAGRVTAALFNSAPGTLVGLRGPFGNGFPIERFAGRHALLIAGGLGMAPLRALLWALLDGPEQACSVTVLYGSRDPATLLFADELRRLADQGRIRLRFSVEFAREQPWSNQPGLCRIGLVTSLLEGLQTPGASTVAAVCGPPVLYSCVLEELAAAGVPPDQIFATLERRMRCGVGSCCHCVAAGVYVCRQGPVFSLDDLRRLPGAVEGIP